MIAPTPNHVAISSRVTVEAGELESALSTEVLYAQVGQPVGGKDTGSPRSRNEVWLRYPEGSLVTGPPLPGSLLLIDGVQFEVSDTPNQLMQGVRREGWEMRVIDTSLAYPTPVTVYDNQGEVVAEADIAMWSPKETFSDRGEYEEKEGEAPFALYSVLCVRNAYIMVGAQKWRIGTCVLDLDTARVSFSLKNTRSV